MTTNTLKREVFLPWVICALGAVFYCYEFFLRITPGVITTELMGAYDLKGAEVGNFSAFYYHAYVPMQIVVGLLMDRFGPRRLLTVACFICAIGSFLFAGYFGFGWAVAGRFLIGLGSAFAFVGALKLATIWLPPNRFALVSGIILCLGMTGAVIGDFLLRGMVDVIGWQTTIYLSSAVGVVLAFVLWFVVRDASPDHPDYHVHIINFQAIFSGLWKALKNPQIWLNGLVGLLLYVSLSAFAEMWGIQYLEQAKGLSKVYAAHANSMVFLGWAVGGPLWGWFSDFIGRRRMPLFIGTIGAIILVSILLYVPDLSLWAIYITLFLFGLFSSAQILVFAICHETSHITIAGTAIALTNMIVMLSGNIFQPLIGKLLDLGWVGMVYHGARIYTPYSYQQALSILPVSLVCGMVILFFIRETFCCVQK
jgi:sugar phosphate permease